MEELYGGGGGCKEGVRGGPVDEFCFSGGGQRIGGDGDEGGGFDVEEFDFRREATEGDE